MIELTRLELKNFLSHADSTIDLQSHKGLVLIEGKTQDGHYSSNGSGKSTILEGIVYALTGETLRGVGVNDVINRNHKKDTHSLLEFSKDGVPYSVARYRKDSSFGDSIILKKNGEDISKRVNKETQKLLEDILGISYKILVSTMLLGEGLSSRFTQLSDPEKKSLIESTLNLNYDMSKIRDKANAQLKTLRLDEARLSGEISVLSSKMSTDINQLEDSIHDNKELIGICEETSTHLLEEYTRVSAELESINPKIQLINDTINRYNILANNYSSLKQTTDHCQAERDKVLSGSSIMLCALCKQALQSSESKKAVIDNYSKTIDENLAKLSEIELELSKIPDIQALQRKSEELAKASNEKMKLSRSLADDRNSYLTKIELAKKDIENAESIIREASDFSSELEEKKSAKDEVLESIQRYEYFYDLFSPTGIIVNILSDAITYINARLSTYSSVLLEKNYEIQFVKGKISLVDSKGSSYQSLSNGEKRRLDISIQFALHDYVSMYCDMHMDTVFIDEILDTLDDIGVENIFEVLRLKLEYCNLRSIYVITHNDTLKDKFDQVITVRKDAKGDSHIL